MPTQIQKQIEEAVSEPTKKCDHSFELMNIAGLPEEVIFICPKCGTPQEGRVATNPTPLTKEQELQTPESTRKTIDRHSALSKALRALYLEVDASIVESIEMYVANALNTEKTEAIKQERSRVVEMIKKDNHAEGMYGGLAQFTNGYDAAVERITKLIEALSNPTTLDTVNEWEK